MGRAEDAKKTQAVIQIREIMKALEVYRLDNGSYPSTEQGLKALVEKPTGEPEPSSKWKRYMDKVPTDPWKHEFIYIYVQEQITQRILILYLKRKKQMRII